MSYTAALRLSPPRLLIARTMEGGLCDTSRQPDGATAGRFDKAQPQTVRPLSGAVLCLRKVKWVTKWVIKRKRTPILNELAFFLMEQDTGLEPAAYCLGSSRSTG